MSIPIDHYVNWDLARQHLSEIHEVLIETIKIIEIVSIVSDPDTIQIEGIAFKDLINPTELTEDQVKELSHAYFNACEAIKVLCNSLSTGEINNEPRNEGNDHGEVPSLGTDHSEIE